MSPGETVPDLVRVTVTSSTRRVDLVLPGAVPVAELLPELARSVGLLDVATVHGGYHAVTGAGRRLAGDSGLAPQGVADGAVITVAAGADAEPPRLYDDVVEAMTDAVEDELPPWRPEDSRRASLVAAGLPMALGAVALHLQAGSLLAAGAASVVAAGLVVGAVVLSRALSERGAAFVVAWIGCAYGAVAGLLFAHDEGAFFGYPLAATGAGALVAGLVCLVGVREGRALLIPPVVTGTIAATVGLLLAAFDLDAAVLLTTVLAAVVVVGSTFPWLALGMTGTSVDRLSSSADVTADPAVVERDQVAGDARVAHEILVAISATTGLLLVLLAPLAVSRGLAGTLLAVVACLILMLRTRQHRAGSEVLVGLGSGILGLVSVVVALLVLHDDWRPATAVVLAVAGAALLATAVVPSGQSARRGRLGDVAETVSLLSVPPLLVLATGLLSASSTLVR